MRRLYCILLIALCTSCATSRTDADKKTPEEMAKLYVEVGTSALLRADYPAAVENLRKATISDSKNAIAQNHLGLAYYAMGQRALALEAVQEAVKIDPKYSDAYINLGNFAFDQHQNALARKYYTKALENLEYKFRHRALTSLANLSISENNLDEARTFLYQSLQANPDYCLTHFLLGTIFMRDNNATRAADEFGKSVTKTCAGNPQGHYRLGLAYLKLKNYDRARHEFVFLVESFPQTVEAQQAGEQLRYVP